MVSSTLSFANKQAEGDKYTLVCTNKSVAAWVFYVYQTMPEQPSETFSLAWFATPYKLPPGGVVTFDWSIDYSFVWANSGVVAPGVRFTAGQSVPCSFTDANQTTFSIKDNTPNLSAPIPGKEPGSFTLQIDKTVPNLIFATGIGMSGEGIFVQQALANAPQNFIPKAEYWIAAATEMQMGAVLARTSTQAAKVVFQPNVFTLYADLGVDNTWTISEKEN